MPPQPMLGSEPNHVGADAQQSGDLDERRNPRTSSVVARCNFVHHRSPAALPPATPDSFARMRGQNERGKKQHWELGVLAATLDFF